MKRKWADPVYRLRRVPADVRAKMADPQLCSWSELKKHHRPIWAAICASAAGRGKDKEAWALAEEWEAFLPEVKTAAEALALREKQKSNREKARELRAQIRSLQAQVRELEKQ